MKKFILFLSFFWAVSLSAQTTFCSMPTAESNISGDDKTYQLQCYGDSFIFNVDVVDGCKEDSYLIEVAEYVNGSVTNNVAINYYSTLDNGGNHFDLYDFVEEHGNYWNFEGGKTYRVKFSAYIEWWSTWITSAHYVKFKAPAPAISFINSGETYTKYSNEGWSVEVTDFCENDVLVDASASECYDRYRIDVQAWDIPNWEPLGDSESTGWILSTEAPAEFNLSTLLGQWDFIDGVTYKVNVALGMPYEAATIYFKKVASDGPIVDGEFYKIRSEEQLYSQGGGFGFTLYEICPYLGDYIFDASQTQCEGKYKIRIAEFDWQTWTVNDLNPYSSPWTLGQVPDQIILNDLYPQNFEVGKVYLLSIEAASPWTQKGFLFEIPDKLPYSCISEAGHDHDGKHHLEISNIQIHPNPSVEGRATLTLDEFNDWTNGIVNIYSSDGRLLQTQEVNDSNRLDIDLSDQSSGLYYINIQTDHEAQTIKFIKN